MQRSKPLVPLVFLCGACLFPLVFPSPSHGQDRRLESLFGRGAHAYHAANIQEASRYLGQALSEGSQDPRCFYFQGLCYLSQGDPDRANQNFRAGAIREFSGLGTYEVSRSLQRVQGAARTALEQSRREVRRELVERDRRRIRRQPTHHINADSVAVRPSISPDDLPADPNDPFGQADLGAFGEGPLLADSAADASATESTDPFGETVDPFGEAEDGGNNADNAIVDVFGEDDAAGTDPGRAANPAQGSPSGGGIFGSLFRGISRAVTGSRSSSVTVTSEQSTADDPISESPDDVFGDDVFSEDTTDDIFGNAGGQTDLEPSAPLPSREAQPSPGGARSQTITGPRSLIDRIRGMVSGPTSEAQSQPSTVPRPPPTSRPPPVAPNNSEIDDLFGDFTDDPPAANEDADNSSSDMAPADDGAADLFDFSSDDQEAADLGTNPFEDDPIE